MKPTTLLLLCLAPHLIQAQAYQDWIVPHTGDTIRCTITLINEHSIFYSHKPKKIEESVFIALDKVKDFQSKIEPSIGLTTEDNTAQNGTINQPTIGGISGSVPLNPAAVREGGSKIRSGANNLLFGMAVTVGSVGLATLLVNNNSELAGPVAIAGSIFGLIASIYGLAQIAAGGKMIELAERRVNLGLQEHGLGLAMRF